MQEVFASSFLCVWNQMSWTNLETKVLLQDFFMYSYDVTKSKNLRSCESISLKTVLIFPKTFLNL